MLNILEDPVGVDSKTDCSYFLQCKKGSSGLDAKQGLREAETDPLSV